MKQFRNYVSPILGFVFGCCLLILFFDKSGEILNFTLIKFSKYSFQYYFDNFAYLVYGAISFSLLYHSFKSISSQKEVIYKEQNRRIGLLLFSVFIVASVQQIIDFISFIVSF